MKLTREDISAIAREVVTLLRQEQERGEAGNFEEYVAELKGRQKKAVKES